MPLIRFFSTDDSSRDGESHHSEDTKQGHSIAYYEHYRQMFQHGGSSIPQTGDSENNHMPNETSIDSVECGNKSEVQGTNKAKLTHTDSSGRVKMVDVGDKPETKRTARASGRITLGKEAYRLVQDNKMKKGDVLSVAQIAGIMAAKQTSSLIPLCHAIPLTQIDLMLNLHHNDNSVHITSEITSHGKTGVEMEALTAVTVAALTIYDMCKAVTHDMVICDIKLLSKEGGQRGTYQRS